LTTSEKILTAILILIFVSGTLFLLSLADYAWTYSGWNLFMKLVTTLPLVIWLLTCALIVVKVRNYDR
jgi:hypothetical protein